MQASLHFIFSLPFNPFPLQFLSSFSPSIRPLPPFLPHPSLLPPLPLLLLSAHGDASSLSAWEDAHDSHSLPPSGVSSSLCAWGASGLSIGRRFPLRPASACEVTACGDSLRVSACGVLVRFVAWGSLLFLPSSGPEALFLPLLSACEDLLVPAACGDFFLLAAREDCPLLARPSCGPGTSASGR